VKLIRPHRNHPLWYAFILHRISGIALTVFLPLHFYVLSLALTDPGALDSMLHWSEQMYVKLAEFGLVFLLAIHLFGGLRLLALEFLPWQQSQKTLVSLALSIAFFVAIIFLLRGL
jgi:fumarate reductase subunit D